MIISDPDLDATGQTILDPDPTGQVITEPDPGKVRSFGSDRIWIRNTIKNIGYGSGTPKYLQIRHVDEDLPRPRPRSAVVRPRTTAPASSCNTAHH